MSEEFRDGSREGDQAPPIKNDLPIVQELVIQDMVKRLELGIQRYGTGLQPHNGRSMLLDLYQELLDAVVYVRGELEERKLHIPNRGSDVEEYIQRWRDLWREHDDPDWDPFDTMLDDYRMRAGYEILLLAPVEDALH